MTGLFLRRYPGLLGEKGPKTGSFRQLQTNDFHRHR